MRVKRKINRVEQEGAEVLARACKAANIIPANATTAQLVAALERYIDKLHQLAAEMADKYPGEAGDQAQLFIRLELEKTIRKITSLRIRDITPV